MPAGKLSIRFLVLWHTLVAALLFVVAQLRVGGTLWAGRHEELMAGVYLIAAYVLTAAVFIVAAARGRPLRLPGAVATSLSIFGVAFFALLINAPTPPYSRALLICLTVVALLLVVGACAPGKLRRPALGLIAVCLVGFGGLNLYRVSGPHGPLPTVQTETDIRTELYTVHAISVENPVPKSIVRGGGIAVLGDRYLLATGDGRIYTFTWPLHGKFDQLRLLPQRVPFNPDAFSAASHTQWTEADANSERAYSVKGAQTWQFRVADVIVKEEGDRLQLFASHHFWNDKDKCFTVRVSMLEGARADFLAGARLGPWKTLFEAVPCLPLSGPDSLHSNNPFGGMEIGGRMALVGNDALLLTVGDHDFSGVESTRALAQDPTALYGKTILIHLKDGSHEIFTMGHRNPQGLFMDSVGTIWETEHGPQGGDELNILTKGASYGWPVVTYGTDYGSAAWPLDAHRGRHDGFVVPVFAWVPSIGVSSLIRLRGEGFPDWKDDLLIGSLHAKTLYRVRLEGRSAIFAEPIALGARVRDIVEGPDGQILIWTDRYDLISLRQPAESGGAALFGTRCGGCHKIDNGLNNSFGPDLFGIFGRGAGSNESFDEYSPAMKSLGQPWTAERLDAFIANPQEAVPGTAMAYEGLKNPKERAAIVEYLRTAK